MVPLEGELTDPESDIFITIWNIFQNAFSEAFQQAVEGIIEFGDVDE